MLPTVTVLASLCVVFSLFLVFVTLYIVPHNTVQVTRRKISDHNHAGKHTRVQQDLQPALEKNSLDCHVHPKQITLVIVAHKESAHLRSLTSTRVGPLDEVTFSL